MAGYDGASKAAACDAFFKRDTDKVSMESSYASVAESFFAGWQEQVSQSTSRC